MNRKVVMVLLLLGAGLMLTASNLEADFIQCPSNTPTCNGTTVGDIINGTPDLNYIYGMDGDDTIFGGDNPPGGVSTQCNG